MDEEITDDNRDEVQDIAKNILKHAILSQEYQEELIRGYKGDKVEEVIVQTGDTMISNATTKERQLQIMTIIFSFGSEYGSAEIANHAITRMKQWEDEHGERPALLQQIAQAQEQTKNPMDK